MKKKGSNVKKMIMGAAFVVALGVFIFSGVHLWNIYSEYKTGTEEYASLNEQYVKEKVPDDANDQDDAKDNKDNDERDTKKEKDDTSEDVTCPYDVDFDELKKVNSDVVGWIRFETVDISYPVAQGEDNEYYLHNTIEKTYNFAGSIFIDKDNASDLSDRNTLFFGHNMRNGSMFAKLKSYQEEDFFKSNQYFWVMTPKGNYRYQIFSSHIVDAVGDETYTISYKSKKEYQKYLDTIVAKSGVKSDVKVSTEDDIVTLSTCIGNEDYRYVVHGKKVYEEKK